MRKTFFTFSLFHLFTLPIAAQTDSVATGMADQELKGVEVTARRPGTIRNRGLMNGQTLTSQEFTKAACCNLGESFTTNPSVDVSYSDAATGARQIKLLGLSGTYVQMMTENIPNFRGAAQPFALGYVPGPWMQSIQVSKGAASVKNGYESITGQINIEYLKPQLTEQVNANLYGNSMSKYEANADAMFHLTPASSAQRTVNPNHGWSMGVMLHYEDQIDQNDHNHDGFADSPDVQQYNAMLRWAYFSPRYIFQSAVRAIKENRRGGQMESEHVHEISSFDPLPWHPQRYDINQDAHRYEAFAKQAVVVGPSHNTNVALIVNGTFQQMESLYGWKTYDVIQRDLYAQLLFETDITPRHSYSTGLTYQHQYTNESGDGGDFYNGADEPILNRYFRSYFKENTFGGYGQYTYNLNDRLIVMAGIRADHTRSMGRYLTPRAHLKYAPNDILTLRASVGKGHRWVRPLAENSYLKGSGRSLRYDYEYLEFILSEGTPVYTNEGERTVFEEAWNSGVSASLNIPLWGKTLQLNAEYYYTHFTSQLLIDYDTDRHFIYMVESHGRNRSHCFQVDASYPIVNGLELTAAYRRNIVRAMYGGELRDKPLQSKWKGLVTASYKTPLGLWQFDATLQLNGGGRMPTPYYNNNGEPSWASTFGGYEQLNLQLTRWFRHVSVYAGAENLTGFRQKNPIIHAQHPWSEQFDPTLVWGPIERAMFYVGLRIHFEKM